ncbi:MAG TPA: response regulator transcription factor [Chromatiaceae bacterium]|jgi:two-component system response regulator RegA|nr:response regulator transcription factor [Chromatiaceae bacterium]HIB83859.1 response regulator transcription factor [Chromatiaceae bacterium]HIN82813.1 response regulator transcription factor [Chromatiales bacterium]HIO14787.1 response regulator transcription factor [Chromatiales bacterium]HIO55298.1 response regulator transcription factor [Chromatiales bacterium]
MTTDIDEKPNLLLVDDDELFCRVLSGALSSRGLDVHVAYNITDALEVTREHEPEYAIVDLCIGSESGLSMVKQLVEIDANTRIVILTGYASIATAVEGIKLGAVHYLTKPTDADEVVAALHYDEGNSEIPIATRPVSVKRLEWEHLQKILLECDGNISAAARALNMHRRTLQRKLQKRPVNE